MSDTEKDHDCEDIVEPDTCWGCKMRYMRANGGLSVHYQGGVGRKGRDFFHESTIPERQRKIVERAAKEGWEARPVNPLYDRPANFKAKKAPDARA